MTDVSKQYAPQFKGWQAKAMGSKPSDESLQTAHWFGRAGKQSLALAMAMRPEGVTGAQVVMACGAPQNNHRRDVLASGYFKREAVPATEAGHTVYKVTLTAKGEAAIKRRTEQAAAGALTDKPAKAKRKAANRHARKAARKAAPGTGSQPATVTEQPVADREWQAGTPGTPVDPAGEPATS